MLNTKLILIEGLPGAGKSTSTVHLGTVLQQQNFACRYFREEDEPHPIPCLDFAIKGLPGKMIPLWRDFVEGARHEAAITILDSRLWQNTALYMYMSEVEVEEIVSFEREVYQVLTPLSPVLLYLDQEDTQAALWRLYTLRGEQWMNEALEETLQYAWFQSRGLNDFAGWVSFFREWHEVAERLYDDWPHQKIKMLNAHDDWRASYGQIRTFLRVDESP